MAAKKSKTQKMKKKWAEMEEEMFQQRDSRNKTLTMETKKDEQLFVVDATATKATTTSPSLSGGGGGVRGAFLTKKQRARTVSYTHLTLPTICSV